MATAKESFPGYSGDTKRASIGYLVRDAADEQAARAAIAAVAPALRGGLVIKNNPATEIGNGLYRGQAQYGEATDPPRPAASSSTYTFSVQVEPETFFYSSNRLAKYPASAPDPGKGRIGIEVDQSQGRWSGISVPAGPVTDEISYEYPAAVIPESYRNLVRDYVGAVNSDTFLGQPAGTMRFVRCTASVTAGDRQTIAFGFAHRPNQSNVEVGDITIPNVDGWDFYWSYDEMDTLVDGTTSLEIPFPKPIYVYLERLLERKPFAALGIDL